MEKLRHLFQTEKKEILFAFVGILFSLLFAPNGLYLLIGFLLAAVLTLLVLRKRKAERERLLEQVDSLTFLSDFLDKIEKGVGTKEAYRESATWLLGYFSPIPYEEIADQVQAPYALGSYSATFLHVLRKDRENEAYLLDYRNIREEIDKSLVRLKKDLSEDDRLLTISKCAFVLFLLIFLFSTILFPGMKVGEESSLFGLLSFLLLCLFVPGIYLGSLLRLGGIQNA